MNSSFEESQTSVYSGAGISSLDAFLNIEFGAIGRTVSTKREPNTSRQFYFWIDDQHQMQQRIEIGNIIAALSDDNTDITFGIVTEMRSYSDIDSFIADYLSHNFGEATIEVPTDISMAFSRTGMGGE